MTSFHGCFFRNEKRLLFPFWKVLQFLESRMKVDFKKIDYNILNF
jgi:hypothetical protein